VQLTLFPNGNMSFRYSPNATNNSTYGGSAAHGVVGISRGVPTLPVLPIEVDMSAAPSSVETTFYELFQVANTFDLPDNGIDLVPTFPGYSVTPALGPPSSCAESDSYGASCGGLTLVSDRPVIGAHWTLTTTGIDPASPISVTFLATDPLVPGVSLLAALGINAPGCDINLATPPLLGDVVGANSGGVSTVLLPIPPMAGLAGASLAAQSLCLTFGNPANVYLSNGNLGILDLN
jgi:hypothetical protein